jgi:hypothetical protein
MLPLGCVCAVAHWGRAGSAAIYGAAPIFTLRMGERSGVQICLLVVFGALRGYWLLSWVRAARLARIHSRR